jgi:hypothetical protein
MSFFSFLCFLFSSPLLTCLPRAGHPQVRRCHRSTASSLATLQPIISSVMINSKLNLRALPPRLALIRQLTRQRHLCCRLTQPAPPTASSTSLTSAVAPASSPSHFEFELSIRLQHRARLVASIVSRAVTGLTLNPSRDWMLLRVSVARLSLTPKCNPRQSFSTAYT